VEASCQDWRGRPDVIRARLLQELGLHTGDRVVLDVSEGELRVRSLDVAIRRAQELVAAYVSRGVPLADELIRKPRQEAARELREIGSPSVAEAVLDASAPLAFCSASQASIGSVARCRMRSSAASTAPRWSPS
jgi:antitoxin component of MazEF toxin-antitoxin module